MHEEEVDSSAIRNLEGDDFHDIGKIEWEFGNCWRVGGN